MKFFKKKVNYIITFMLGMLLMSGMVYATNYVAGNINYTRNGNTVTVANALDDLYTKIPSGTLNITSNQNNIDVAQYEKVNVNVENIKHETKNVSAANLSNYNYVCGYRPSYYFIEVKYSTNKRLGIFGSSTSVWQYTENYGDCEISNWISLTDTGIQFVNWATDRGNATIEFWTIR